MVSGLAMGLFSSMARLNISSCHHENSSTVTTVDIARWDPGQYHHSGRRQPTDDDNNKEIPANNITDSLLLIEETDQKQNKLDAEIRSQARQATGDTQVRGFLVNNNTISSCLCVPLLCVFVSMINPTCR